MREEGACDRKTHARMRIKRVSKITHTLRSEKACRDRTLWLVKIPFLKWERGVRAQ
jgi:hypothetical protein